MDDIFYSYPKMCTIQSHGGRFPTRGEARTPQKARSGNAFHLRANWALRAYSYAPQSCNRPMYHRWGSRVLISMEAPKHAARERRHHHVRWSHPGYHRPMAMSSRHAPGDVSRRKRALHPAKPRVPLAWMYLDMPRTDLAKTSPWRCFLTMRPPLQMLLHTAFSALWHERPPPPALRDRTTPWPLQPRAISKQPPPRPRCPARRRPAHRPSAPCARLFCGGAR